MPIRNGKIANLPNDIREQLNLRLLEGETGQELAAWLNALPEVQSILDSQFKGAPVSEVNLTHWRQGGYLQWFTERECFDAARALADGDGDLASVGLSAERLLNVLTVRFGQILMRWDSTADDSISESVAFSEIARKARILQGISRSVLAIHRIQSQSALKKSEPATSSTSANAASKEHVRSNPVTAPEIPKAPLKARPTGAAPNTGRKSALRQTQGLEPVGELGALSLSRRLAETAQSKIPKILSGPITPSNLSHTPFNPDHILEEILNAG